MSNQTVTIKSLLRIAIIAIAINSTMGSMIPATAQETNKNNQSESVANGNNGLPSHRRDGGTRGSNCAVNSQEFVALIPDTAVGAKQQTTPLLTASTNPRLYFHVPQTNQSQTIEFVLRDSSDRLIYETTIETEGKSGIMSIKMPLPAQDRAKSLDSNRDYRWYLSNICNPEKRSQDIVLEGWIEQIELSAITQEKLAQLSLAEQASFYQEKGVWHDALAIAAREIETKKGELSATKWSEFLTNIGLAEFVNKPLID
jgi:hypothetical protein